MLQPAKTSVDPTEIKDIKKVTKSYFDLNDKERQVLIGLMLGSNDIQAQKFARVATATFYHYKPRLVKILNDFEASLAEKTWLILKGAMIEAAQVLTEGLRQPSYRYRFEAAKNILDRVIGQPTQKIETRGQITILGIEMSQDQVDNLTKPIDAEIIGQDQKQDPSLKSNPIALDNYGAQPTNASLTAENTKDGLDITEV